MQAYPLTLTNHLKRARAFFPDKQIVSKLEAGVFRYTYRDFAGRVAQLANVLRGLGIGQGDLIRSVNDQFIEALFEFEEQLREQSIAVDDDLPFLPDRRG